MFRGDGDGTRKLSAAWLIDACGWKGHRDGDAGVSPDHALVLVNHGAASGAQLLALARRIAASVHERFDVALEPEPRIVGARWRTHPLRGTHSPAGAASAAGSFPPGLRCLKPAAQAAPATANPP